MEDNIFYSICGEIYYKIDTVADMIEDDPEVKTIHKGIGIFKSHKDFIDADDIIERAKDRAYEDNEYAEGYLDDITKEKEEELNKLIIDWLNNNGEQPTFFTVKNIDQITSEEFHKEHLK